MLSESKSGLPPVERWEGAEDDARTPDDATSDFHLPAVPDVSRWKPRKGGEVVFALFFVLFALAKVVEWLLRLMGLL